MYSSMLLTGNNVGSESSKHRSWEQLPLISHKAWKQPVMSKGWWIDVYCLSHLGSAGASDLIPCKSLLRISVKCPLPSPWDALCCLIKMGQTRTTDTLDRHRNSHRKAQTTQGQTDPQDSLQTGTYSDVVQTDRGRKTQEAWSREFKSELTLG